MSLPDDLILGAADEVAIRQNLTLVALGKRPADRVIEVGRLLAVHANHWLADQEIVISGRRIAYVGPIGFYRGTVGERMRHRDLSAVPGFGEVHKLVPAEATVAAGAYVWVPYRIDRMLQAVPLARTGEPPSERIARELRLHYGLRSPELARG